MGNSAKIVTDFSKKQAQLNGNGQQEKYPYG